MAKELEDFGLVPPYLIGKTREHVVVLMDSNKCPIAGFSGNQRLELARAVARDLTSAWETRTAQRTLEKINARVRATTDPSKE